MRYVVRPGGALSLALGAYEPSVPLTIDPILVYATYLGGTGEDIGGTIAVDAGGNAYVTDETMRTDLSTAGNRTAVQLNGGTPATTSYNAANQITNSGFTYDALNRTTVRGTTTYAYNGDGTLVSQTASSVTTHYTQNLAAPLMLLRGVSPRAPAQGISFACGSWRGASPPHPRPGNQLRVWILAGRVAPWNPD